MKKMTILCLVAMMLMPLLGSEKEVVAKADKFFRAKDYNNALKTLDEGITAHGTTAQLVRFKYRVLLRLEKYDEALSILDEAIKKQGEDARILGQKMYVLQLQKKYDEAIKVGLRAEELAKKKSPWSCLDLADLYIAAGNKDEAFKWFDEAINRGFNDYSRLLRNTRESGLHGDKRLDKLVAKIKSNIGIGRQAKDFTIKLLDGTPYQLSAQKGKVVLVDFWATWCGPCRREMPNLKECYQAFGTKGFEIIGISLDEKEEALKDYQAKEKLPWKISYTGKGWGDDTARAYGVKSIPSYWLIDKAGRLQHFGLRGEALKKAIGELLAAKAEK